MRTKYGRVLSNICPSCGNLLVPQDGSNHDCPVHREPGRAWLRVESRWATTGEDGPLMDKIEDLRRRKVY